MAKFPEFSAHPAANLFPMLTDAELSALGSDIARNGQRHSIKLWNRMIVDGRNRYEACRKSGIPPAVEDIDFKDEAECIRYIISENIHRRHLTVEQRADIADELARLRPGDNQHTREVASKEATSPVMSQDEAAKAMGISRSSVQRIHAIKEQAPDLAEKVKAGELKVSKAARIVKERTKSKEKPATKAGKTATATDMRAKSTPMQAYFSGDDGCEQPAPVNTTDECASEYRPDVEKVWKLIVNLSASDLAIIRKRMHELDDMDTEAH